MPRQGQFEGDVVVRVVAAPMRIGGRALGASGVFTECLLRDWQQEERASVAGTGGALRGSTLLLLLSGEGLEAAGNGANRARLSPWALRVQARGWFSPALVRAFSRWRGISV